jgi:hypothetical protein
MATIIPEAQVLPKYFTSHRVYRLVERNKPEEQYDPAWEFDPASSDPTLTQQVNQFVVSTGAVLVNGGVSAPTVQLYQDSNKRIYILACAIMYIPMVEHADDKPRAVDGPLAGSKDTSGEASGPVDVGDLV